MGDLNNVLRSQDRIRGNVVHENKYKDLKDMMGQANLFEKDTMGVTISLGPITNEMG